MRENEWDHGLKENWVGCYLVGGVVWMYFPEFREYTVEEVLLCLYHQFLDENTYLVSPK